jgi:hypothetical protein
MKWLVLAATIGATAVARELPQDDPSLRPGLEAALREYFAAERAQGPALQEVLKLAKGHDELLADVIRKKTFVQSSGPVARHGVIDARYRFRDVGAAGTDSKPAPARREGNDALFFGPAASASLSPLVVFVPDATSTSGYDHRLATDGTAAGRFIYLVPDEKQDNSWNPTLHEERRHVGPLRDFLLGSTIDPDRVYLVGTGRGGHATWDVGLLYPDRFAGIFPCNGGLIHEGGWKASGGVFLENAKCLDVHTVYNTTFDHGIESCRYAAARFKEWKYRFEAVEEQAFRHMEVPEAMAKLEKTVRDAHPREIVKRFNHLDAGEHFWLRALDRVPREWDPAARMTLKAPWPTEPQKQRDRIWEHVRGLCALLRGSIEGSRFVTITIEARGIGKVRVYFDPEIVDYAGKISVVLNGKMHAVPPLSKKAEVMLQHVHETGDTARLYWAFQDFAAN